MALGSFLVVAAGLASAGLRGFRKAFEDEGRAKREREEIKRVRDEKIEEVKSIALRNKLSMSGVLAGGSSFYANTAAQAEQKIAYIESQLATALRRATIGPSRFVLTALSGPFMQVFRSGLEATFNPTLPAPAASNPPARTSPVSTSAFFRAFAGRGIVPNIYGTFNLPSQNWFFENANRSRSSYEIDSFLNSGASYKRTGSAFLDFMAERNMNDLLEGEQ